MSQTLKDQKTTGRIRVATGTDAEGKTIFANRSISDVNPTVTENDFCNVMGGFASLSADELGSVFRVDTKEWELDD